mmetsp:Transcript_53963/g.124231  ORF Transcript_53963/g.124231 Transcript_53963/m.124231 type:complete len:307 (-) Transcript_53963:729-1649(-)
MHRWKSRIVSLRQRKIEPVEPRHPHHQVLRRPVDASRLHPNVELQDVRLQSHLTAPREEVHRVPAHAVRQIAQHEITQDGNPRRVRVKLVVLALGQHKRIHVPVGAQEQHRSSHARLGGESQRGWQLVDALQLPVSPWEAESAEHAEDPHQVVEVRTEIPLVKCVGKLGVQRVMEAEQRDRRAEDPVEDALESVEHEGDHHEYPHLEEQESIAAVQLVTRPERDVHPPREEGVHWANVVEHVLVVHGGAHKEDKEIQTPHHLREPHEREILLDVVVREVAKAREEDVSCNVQPNSIVDFSLREVVI